MNGHAYSSIGRREYDAEGEAISDGKGIGGIEDEGSVLGDGWVLGSEYSFGLDMRSTERGVLCIGYSA
ncbi:uncharacterized protein G2W53_010815 [Senna tora]|uniref:Uncharacterized protein n=1 Tax=Senna tora TaxID=362788 RepID=A0A834X0L6_9FABA|nr:uncharacterized protein G2W53_010815 [Senna tora]